jgi:hypothetical protein
METTSNRQGLMNTIFKGIAVAMGIAVIVLGILGTLATATATTLLGIGLTALALAVMKLG